SVTSAPTRTASPASSCSIEPSRSRTRGARWCKRARRTDWIETCLGAWSRMKTKQLSFRLPKALVDRVDRCVRESEASGLDLTRADVVRLLLNYALTATDGRLSSLIEKPKKKRGA